MKKLLFVIAIMTTLLSAETLFEVKDASNNKVFDISNDGLRVFNLGDTLMVISSSAINANISSSKGLSRTFSVTTSSSKDKGSLNALEVGNGYTTMSAGQGRYTNFSPINMFLGLNSGASIGGAKYNVFIGNYSGYTTTGPEEPDMFEFGYYNTFLGFESGRNATNSMYNTYIGSESGKMNSNGTDNTFIGCKSGSKNTGYSNTIIGAFSGNGIGNGNSNAFVGMYSGSNNTSGSSNTFLGHGAGEGNLTGSSNVYIGKYSGGGNTSGTGNVYIGNSAGSSATGSNKLFIANTNTLTPLIYGDFSTNNIGLGTNAPGSNRLKVINNASGIAGATGYFENSNSTGIGMAVYATSTDAALYAEQKNTSSTTASIAKFASQYGGTWHETVVFRNSGAIIANNLSSGTGTALYLTSGNEIVKLSSSKKYKKDIAPLSADMKKFMSLQPVRFVWNEKSASEGKADYGLIAEEVEKIDPALAVYNDKGEIEGVDYQKINIMLLKVVQDQEKKIDELEKRLDKIESR